MSGATAHSVLIVRPQGPGPGWESINPLIVLLAATRRDDEGHPASAADPPPGNPILPWRVEAAAVSFQLGSSRDRTPQKSRSAAAIRGLGPLWA